jgi:hypothetical protein
MNALKGKQMDWQNAQIFTVPVVGVPAMRNREAINNAKVVFSFVSPLQKYSIVATEVTNKNTSEASNQLSIFL